jgi:hypothetical protein
MFHAVSFDLPTRDLGKSDIHFTVKADGHILGTLGISKGSLVWFPKDRSYGHKMSWSELDREMQDYPRLEKRKKKR